VTFPLGLAVMAVSIIAMDRSYNLAEADKTMFAIVFLTLGGVLFFVGFILMLNGYAFRILSTIAEFVDKWWDRFRENRRAGS
jgi:hypothetical protein